MYGYIYKITNPIGQVYIGQTKNIEKRKGRYRSNVCKQQKLIYRSIKKYGWSTHKFDIVYKCIYDKSTINEAEIFFIKFFNSYWYDNKQYGLNLTRGGDGTSGHKLSEEHKAKLVAANRGNTYGKGRVQTEEEKRKSCRNKSTNVPNWLLIAVITDINNSIPIHTIADKYGINKNKVYNIKYQDRPYSRDENVPKVKVDIIYRTVDQELIKNVEIDILNKLTNYQIADKYKLKSYQTVSYIVRKHLPHLKNMRWGRNTRMKECL